MIRLLRVMVEICLSSKVEKFKVQDSDAFRSYGKTTFLIPDTREVFNQLRQAFIKVLILQHFDPECYIQIETDALSYAIEGVLNQLTSNH